MSGIGSPRERTKGADGQRIRKKTSLGNSKLVNGITDWIISGILARPPSTIGPPRLRAGQCYKQGCSNTFIGPPSRKWCDEHSSYIKFAGK